MQAIVTVWSVAEAERSINIPGAEELVSWRLITSGVSFDGIPVLRRRTAANASGDSARRRAVSGSFRGAKGSSPV
jgi:hypothetical protein